MKSLLYLWSFWVLLLSYCSVTCELLEHFSSFPVKPLRLSMQIIMAAYAKERLPCIFFWRWLCSHLVLKTCFKKIRHIILQWNKNVFILVQIDDIATKTNFQTQNSYHMFSPICYTCYDGFLMDSIGLNLRMYIHKTN